MTQNTRARCLGNVFCSVIHSECIPFTTGAMHATRAHHATICSRTSARETRTHLKTRQIHMANICGRRGPRTDRARRAAGSAAAPTQNDARRRDTPPARAASAKQRAPQEIKPAQHPHACRECTGSGAGRGRREIATRHV